MNSSSWIAAVISLVGVSVFFLLFQQKNYSPRQGKRQRRIALLFKGTATLFAAALAVYGTVLSPTAGNILLTAGLFVCMAADVLLGIRLLWGVAAFGVGHIFYCAACIFSAPPGFANLAVYVLLFALCLLLLYPKIKNGAGDKPVFPFVAYGAVLFLMLSLAINQRPVLLAGAVFFVISDCMLAFRLFMNNRSVPFDYICLGCYYLGQFLIGFSTLVS